MANQEEDRSLVTFTGDSLPEDVIMDILSRLTVKCLLQLRAVSKTWLSIISNPTFVNLQYSRAIASRENEDSFIVNCLKGNDDSISLLRLHSCRIGVDLSRPCSEDNFKSVPRLFLVGSCNGIICILVSKDPARSKFLRGTYMCQNHETYLWNPATKQSKLLPLPTIRENKDTRSSSFGFGFDPISNDFKVVRVVTLGQGLSGTMVYSTNTNAWQELEPNTMKIPSYNSFDVCLNGYLYCTWLRGLMTFDLNKYVFDYIYYPDNVLKTLYAQADYFQTRISEFKDSIAVITYNDYGDNLFDGIIHLWTLNDASLPAGIKGSWTLMLSFDIFGIDMVCGYLNGGNHILVTDSEELFLYDLFREEEEYFPFKIRPFEFFKYTESLVSIRGTKQVISNRQRR